MPGVDFRAAALATAAVTALGCGATVTPVANGPGLHNATDIGFSRTEGPPLTAPQQIRFAARHMVRGRRKRRRAHPRLPDAR